RASSAVLIGVLQLGGRSWPADDPPRLHSWLSIVASAKAQRRAPAERLDSTIPADQSARSIRVGISHGRSVAISTVPLQMYVPRVWAGEAARPGGPAALDALAIAIRTYAVANRGRHQADGFDLCDSTHCQVFGTAKAETDRAAARTAGQILLYDGVPAPIYYS